MNSLPKTNPILEKLGESYLKRLSITYYFIQSQNEARNMEQQHISEAKENLLLNYYHSTYHQSSHNYIRPLHKRIICEK